MYTIVVELDWDSSPNEFKVTVTTDPPGLKVPEEVLEAIADELRLDRPVEIADVKGTD